MSKLCPHIQVLDSRTLAAIGRVQPPMVKTMDLNRQALHSIRRTAPGALIVARHYVAVQDFSNPWGAGRSYAEMYWGVLDLVDVVEVYNEAVNNTTPRDRLALFDVFQDAFARRVWELNSRVQVGLFCLPTGNFGYPGEPKLTDFPKSLALSKDRVYICLHEYSWHTWDWESPARCLRYRRLMEGLTGYQVLITECGLTQAVLPGKPDVGWRTGVPRDVFVSGAAWYDAELQKDDYVVGAAMFACGQSYGWDTFECTDEWEEATRMATSVKPPLVQPPPLTQPIRVMIGDEIKTLELEEYLRGVVPAEMPALWPMEALRAQAVAARSYARWRLENPRSSDFDIYGDARDHVHNVARIHPRSDQAIADTAGVVVQNVVARYVNRCGRGDCEYCKGKNGYQNKCWEGRLCQYGAKTMAENGATWREILVHYYGESVFGKATGGGGEMSNVVLYKDPATNEFKMDAGRVVGCRVDILKAEDTPNKPTLKAGDRVFRVVKLLFINEEQARGDTRILVQVLDQSGKPTMAKVINAWPQQRMPRWDGTAYDWSSPARVAEFAQGSGNYDPAKHGPLGPYVIFIEQDMNKQPVVSDWCVGFGLPGNRHVAYQVIYQEQVVGKELPQPDEPTELSGCSLLVAALINLLRKFQ